MTQQDYTQHPITSPSELVASLRNSAPLGIKYASGANLEGADLCGVNLKRANLKGANLKGANLKSANLKNAYLYGANLESAYLYSANLKSADLDGANLKGADLKGAKFYNANLKSANVKGTILESQPSLKEQALEILEINNDVDSQLSAVHYNIICSALEELPNDWPLSTYANKSQLVFNSQG